MTESRPAHTWRILHSPCLPHYKFNDGTAETLPYPYGYHPWALIQRNKEICHQITISGPGGGGILHPVTQIGDDDYKLLQSASRVKEPISQLNRLCYQRSSGT